MSIEIILLFLGDSASYSIKIIFASQLRKHYPEVLELRERARQQLGINDNLPRGVRQWGVEQYAEAVELLCSDLYITVQAAAERCNVSYIGLEQHLLFYHKELVDNSLKVKIRNYGGYSNKVHSDLHRIPSTSMLRYDVHL